MITKELYAQLALRVYDTARKFEDENLGINNRPRVPAGWTEDWRPDNEVGFSVGIYRNTSTGAVVVAFTGTNQLRDWQENVNYSNEQLKQAAVIAASVIDRYGANNVSFTGHSLGGGLASLMAVWFDRPATVFDQRPMQAIALDTKNWQEARDLMLQSGFSVGAFNTYQPTINFFSRESRVTHFYTEGEILQSLRTALAPIEGSGQVTTVQFGTQQLDLGPFDNAVALHSQALLTAGLMKKRGQTPLHNGTKETHIIYQYIAVFIAIVSLRPKRKAES